MNEKCTTKGCSELSHRHIGRSHLCEPHYEEWQATRCEAITWGDGRAYHPPRCLHKATKERDGRKVCGAHARERGPSYIRKDTP